MNNKGFTLIELLAVVLLLAIISTIATYAVSTYIKATRTKSDELLWDNIRIASQEYIDECTNGVSSLSCPSTINNNPPQIKITLKNLANKGFLNTTTDNNNNMIVLDSKNRDIGSCNITITRSVDDNYIIKYTVESENNDRCKDLKNKKTEF